jgi:hypothetical protein
MQPLLFMNSVTVHSGPCEEDGSVMWGGESFTAAGIPCRRELWTLGVVKVIKKGEKPGHFVGLGKECRNTE